MELKIGQTWISDEFPHESFKIYDGIIDPISDTIMDFTLPFDKQPENSKLFFWERINREEFHKFVESKKGENYISTYPYAISGESKKRSILGKIKKYNMRLLNN